MRISKLTPSKRGQDRWILQLEDGSFLQVGKNQMADFALYDGRELTEEELEDLRRAERHDRFQSYALRVLMDTPMSRKRLVEHLCRKACPEEEAQAIAQRMVDLGVLNEGGYAAEVARQYASRGYGPRRVRDELYRRGVPREHWDAALQEVEDWEEGMDAFLRKRLGGTAPDPKDLKRASDALARRGYGWGEINAALRRYGAEIEEE